MSIALPIAIPFLPTIATAVTAFTATNLDDIVLLLLVFSQIGPGLKVLHVVVGQYLGFGLLIVLSLAGYFGSLLIPSDVIGLLGLLPISIGISRLMDNLDSAQGEPVEPGAEGNAGSQDRSGPLAAALSVAAVTVANGGDNIGIYLPLFASTSGPELIVTLSVFALMMGLWCWLAWRLMQAPTLADLLSQYGRQLIPFVLIALGALILVDSHTLDQRGLAVFSLACVGLMLLSLGRQLGALAHQSAPATPRHARP